MGSISSLVLRIFHFWLSLLPAFISSRIYGTLFMLSSGLKLELSDKIIKSTTELTDDKLPTTTYSVSKAVSPRTRTILIIHGISSTGNEDPRIVQLARSFAAADPDSLVVVPYVPPLAQCRMGDGSVEAILRCINALAADPALCPTGRLSLASACISAGFSLVAASHTEAVEAMLCIGAHASVKNLFLHAVEHMGKDDSRYGINATLASFMSPPNPRLSELLAAYCKDDHCKNVGLESDELRPLLEKYPEEAELYRLLHEDDEYLEKALIDCYYSDEPLFESMSPIERKEYINLKNLVLVHAETDDIVSPKESQILASAFAGRKEMNTRLLITSLLNHGDQKAIGLADVAEVLRLIDCFSGFFLPSKRGASDKTL